MTNNIKLILGLVIGGITGFFMGEFTHSCNSNDNCQAYKNGQVEINESANKGRLAARYYTAFGNPKTKNEFLLYNYLVEDKNHDFFDKAHSNQQWPFGSKIQIGNDY